MSSSQSCTTLLATSSSYLIIFFALKSLFPSSLPLTFYATGKTPFVTDQLCFFLFFAHCMFTCLLFCTKLCVKVGCMWVCLPHICFYNKRFYIHGKLKCLLDNSTTTFFKKQLFVTIILSRNVITARKRGILSQGWMTTRLCSHARNFKTSTPFNDGTMMLENLGDLNVCILLKK